MCTLLSYTFNLYDIVLPGYRSVRPTTIVQAEGLIATFICQVPTDSGGIEWQINGTSLCNVNVSGGQIRREGHENLTEALIITALAQF